MLQKIIDVIPFDVSPQWKWNGEIGNTERRPAGYDAPEINAYGDSSKK
jgi:hypothetical protein